MSGFGRLCGAWDGTAPGTGGGFHGPRAGARAGAGAGHLTCQVRPSLIHISSYMLPRKLRLVPFDAKFNKVSGKIMRVQNEFVDFEISSKHRSKITDLSVTEKLPTSSPLLPNYS